MFFPSYCVVLYHVIKLGNGFPELRRKKKNTLIIHSLKCFLGALYKKRLTEIQQLALYNLL